jgi:integrase
LSIRELLEFLLDDKAKRRLSLMSKTNHELFTMYYDHLRVKLTQDQFKQYQRLLDLLHRFLGEFPPSAELATEFLAQYANRSKATMVRYVGIIKGFMDWYGESLDIRVPKPKLLPQYVEPADIEKLADVIENKSTHKDTIVRDILLLRFATLTGLRRSELANLKVQDINLRQKMVKIHPDYLFTLKPIVLTEEKSVSDAVHQFVADGIRCYAEGKGNPLKVVNLLEEN